LKLTRLLDFEIDMTVMNLALTCLISTEINIGIENANVYE